MDYYRLFVLYGDNNYMREFLKKQPTVRIIAIGFALAILLGSALLILPCSLREGVRLSYIDALYTSTSAVCVTGLVVVDSANTFTPLGRFFLIMLIQIGGLGVTTIGTGIILALGKKMDLKERNLIKDTLMYNSGKGISKFLRDVFITTLIIEFIGAALGLIVFAQDYPIGEAIGISVFHSIASFNNSGFDIFGDFQSISPYQNNVFLNLLTSALIFTGGIGFLVIKDLINKKFRWKKLTMHSKIVLTFSLVLIILGTLLFKLTEKNNISWLGAFFTSVSARTAGFASYSIGAFSTAGLLVLIVLMFIGASPGSTGGGIRTTTFFVVMRNIFSSATNKKENAFHYSIPKETTKKAYTIFIVGLFVIMLSTFLVCIFEPQIAFTDVLFEMTSAFGTVGLSTGITPSLSTASKIISILVMYIGRLGPMTILTMWYFSVGDAVRFPEGNISVG